MKVIFGVDAITRPLTGIGRYAWELAKRLPASDDIQEVSFFTYGKFLTREALLCIGDDSSRTPAHLRWDLISALRRRLARSLIASWAYGKVLPALGRVRLRSYADYLFHSPSFLLPCHDGPSISTIHDLSIFCFPQWHPQNRVRRMNKEIEQTLKKASHLITDSETVRQEIIKHFLWPAGKVTAVPLGVNSTFFPRGPSETTPILSSFGLTPGAYALCVATIEPRKNIEQLISAFEKLPLSLRQSYPLVLVGDIGWTSEGIHKRIDEARRRGWLKYLGYVREVFLPALYSGCRAFLYPSLYEGFGLPLLESMACGAPVLTSNCSSMPEVVGDAGILVDPCDILSISNGIERVLTDETWRSRTVALGIERARPMTWDVSASKTVEVYRQVWDGKRLPD
jgi:glycosyltransferase involved in cell wall biosynthesis